MDGWYYNVLLQIERIPKYHYGSLHFFRKICNKKVYANGVNPVLTFQSDFIHVCGAIPVKHDYFVRSVITEVQSLVVH